MASPAFVLSEDYAARIARVVAWAERYLGDLPPRTERATPVILPPPPWQFAELSADLAPAGSAAAKIQYWNYDDGLWEDVEDRTVYAGPNLYNITLPAGTVVAIMFHAQTRRWYVIGVPLGKATPITDARYDDASGYMQVKTLDVGAVMIADESDWTAKIEYNKECP